jgi:hypothetical protein
MTRFGLEEEEEVAVALPQANQRKRGSGPEEAETGSSQLL